MTRHHIGTIALLAGTLVAQPGPPVASVRPVTDQFGGTTVVDPYRYFEQLSDPGVQAWIRSQNDFSRRTLNAIPGREAMLARIRELNRSTSAQVDAVVAVGDRLFYRSTTGSVQRLLTRRGSGAPAMLMEAESLGLFAPSHDGKLVAVLVSRDGLTADADIQVVDVESGVRIGAAVQHAADTAITWLPDNRSFTYGRFEAGNNTYRTYVRRIGDETPSERPVVVTSAFRGTDDPGRNVTAIVAEPESDYVVAVVNFGASTTSAMHITQADMVGRSGARWRRLADISDDVSAVAIHHNDVFVLTSNGTPRFKVVRTDARNPDLTAAETVVAPGDAVVSQIAAAADALYVHLSEGATSRLARVPYDGPPRVEPIRLPYDGAIGDLAAHVSRPGVVFSLTSWARASSIYAYDAQQKLVVDTGLQPRGPFSDPHGLESSEVLVRSQDGVQVPLSIVRSSRRLHPAGQAPALLTSYGAYGYVQRPLFVPPLLAWYEKGGVWAVCHVRGGGEYGDEWHRAGQGAAKANTWRDWIACAEYLVAQKITAPSKLAGDGVSAGAIGIGRAMIERPDLFGAAAINAGLLDMIRSETTPNGAANVPEFGSVRTAAGFEALHAMSPYAQVRDHAPYPAALLSVGMNDPRVPPWHSAKMAARLQAASSSGKPVLLRVDYAAGHVAETPAQFEDHLADEFCFLLWQFGAPAFQPKRDASAHAMR